jgi:hypothetical protein
MTVSATRHPMIDPAAMAGHEPMTGAYHKTIVACGCPAELAFALEELMRDQYGTLDHLDRTAFRREIKLGLAVIVEIRELAKSGDSTGIALVKAYRIPVSITAGFDPDCSVQRGSR